MTFPKMAIISSNTVINNCDEKRAFFFFLFFFLFFCFFTKDYKIPRIKMRGVNRLQLTKVKQHSAKHIINRVSDKFKHYLRPLGCSIVRILSPTETPKWLKCTEHVIAQIDVNKDLYLHYVFESQMCVAVRMGSPHDSHGLKIKFCMNNKTDISDLK